MEKTHYKYLEVATAIGARLCRDALWAGRRCNWLGPSMEFVENQWSIVHRAFGPDLYGGTSGIGLFLARLFAETRERLFRKTAEGALQHAISRWGDLGSSNIGFYSGLTGVAYVLIHSGEALQNQEFVDKGLEILVELSPTNSDLRQLDVVSGSAGAIPAFLHLYHRYPQSSLLELSIQQGHLLLESAEEDDAGLSWNTLGESAQRNLTGFSHGTAGIAWALLELYAETGEPKFRFAAERAFQYEQHWFSADEENWPDFRAVSTPSAQNQPSYGVAWCHGAPGIGLSRIRAYQILNQSAYADQAEAAVRTTTKVINLGIQSKSGNFSLCHGNAGNAELLLVAGQVLKSTEADKALRAIAQHGINDYHVLRRQWPCGVMGAGETPNLMLGVAGIGYFYLRLHNSRRVPSILLLDTSARAACS